MDSSWPAGRGQLEYAMVAGASGPSGSRLAGVDGGRLGTDSKPALGPSLRIRRSGSNFRRTHRHMRYGDHSGENALEQQKPMRGRRPTCEKIRGAAVTSCYVLEPMQCHNGFVDFDALARQHKDAVYRQMIRVCGNHEDAEDVLIEALLKAYRHLDQLRESAAFRAWLAQIAKRVCWQLKEREALLPLLQLSTLEDEGRELAGAETPPDVQLARQEMKQLLNEAIEALPPLYRTVYELCEIDDLPGDEVARRLEISRAAMKSRLHRARDLVRSRLDAALARQAEQ
jgi:RNA polymerase sigma-70 factor, ECF subfamily